MIQFFFYITIFLLAGISILHKYKFPKNYFYSKPLTIFAIILMPVLLSSYYDSFFFLILAGLIFSSVGDIFLLRPDKYFIHGLAAFLSAHIIYSIAFFIFSPEFVILPAILWVILFIVTIRTLRIHKTKYFLPVIVYAAAICMMGYSAMNYALTSIDSSKGILMLTGALLFVVSDLALAINKFNRKYVSAEFIILSTYFFAQTLIASAIIL